MSYYDTIRYPSSFLQQAKTKKYVNFESLSQSNGFQNGASGWDSRYLFACRVLCSSPEWRLSFLEAFFPDQPREIPPCIQDLIAGPANLRIPDMSEPQIVQMCQPDSLGYVWAALASLVRAEGIHTVNIEAGERTNPSNPERPGRERTQATYDGFVASDSFAIGSSPDRPQTASTDSDHSIGYRGSLSARLLEDATIRLASCFIRCVLNYAQPVDKTGPFIHFRDERLTHHYRLHQQDIVRAMDDGGLQLINRQGVTVQVALLEGKGNFQIIADGEPKVTDEWLAQLVGEALALSRSVATSSISSDSVFSILAVADCVKFFRFKLSHSFIQSFRTTPILHVDDGDTFLQVESTPWLSIKMLEHRKLIVSHLLAMIAWADSLA